MCCPYICKRWENSVFFHGVKVLVPRMGALALVLASFLLVFTQQPAKAIEAIPLTGDKDVIDISQRGVFYEGRGDRLQVETAAGRDGIAGRMAVRAAQTGSNPRWVVFALHNSGSDSIEQWLTTDRYSLNGSKFFDPDLDKGRIGAVTPSVGFAPERVASDKSDIFRLSVEAGATVTFVVELSGTTYHACRFGMFKRLRKSDVTGICSTVFCSVLPELWQSFCQRYLLPTTRLCFPPGHSSSGSGLPICAPNLVFCKNCLTSPRMAMLYTARPVKPPLPLHWLFLFIYFYLCAFGIAG